MSEWTSELASHQIESLMEQYRLNACNESATLLLKHYEFIVRMAAGKMSRSRSDLYDDLYQVAQMSMLRLFRQYDGTKGIPFEGYAMKSLIGHLKNYLRDKAWYIQIPRRIKEKGLMVQRAVDELTVELGRSPMVEDIASRLELSIEETIEILAARESYQYLSLDKPLSSEEESAATIGDVIPGDNGEFHALDGRLDLQAAMHRLKEQEQLVLQLVYKEGQTQREVAERLAISQMSVSRIQRRALEKLRRMLQDDEEDG
ncbi:sigma-70 family RNA polymerase sigma factor [Paenibacillus sp. J5C_2022]|uniref:sigma-70 family RNA polymerase sigma factor n=1 Tax=Paenibacillus sp. J5C2022 TaxID=2977129 RepID=UPI0021D22ED1|nr:sigma-70 family RNA polymerase sigma factor [Paenibacillus sp. J5C2022]MCU6710809.1 sigma-70 family RNA polymerase sigma factor [Paenibacillus sp. J5C2022]